MTVASTAFESAGIGPDRYAELRTEQTDSVTISWVSGDPDAVVTSHEEGGCARVIADGASAFVSFTDGDSVSALRAASAHAGLVGDVGHRLAQTEPVEGQYGTPDPAPSALVPLHEKAAVLDGYSRQILSSHSAVTGASLFYKDTSTEVVFLNSEGSRFELRRSDVVLQITIIAGEGAASASQTLSIGTAGEFDPILQLAEDIDDACRVAVELVTAPPVEPGSYDVILDGALAGVWMHETIGHMAEADHHIGDDANEFYPGLQVGPEALTVRDGSGPLGARGHVPVDDEGTIAREVVLVEGGTFRGLLHSRSTAAQFNESPTGNARAVSFRFPPIPRLRTTSVDEGPDEFTAMVADTRRGLLACGFSGGQTDRLSFALTPDRCLRIEEGEIRGLVRSAVLCGHTIDALSRVRGIGSDVWKADSSASCGKLGQWPLPVSSWAPPIRLHALDVRAR